jgi:hypothetical protein
VINREEFTEFLVRAKLSTYAAQADEATMEPALTVTGSRQLEYREPPLLYRDIYFGMTYFVGQEVVYYGDEPIWSMGYAGGVTTPYSEQKERDRIYGFLREVLAHVQPERPFRGPKRFGKGSLYYEDMSQGAIEGFSGYEVIREGVTVAYELRYNGGAIR